MLIPIALPPGLYNNGTSYASKGRWYLGNRVRWYDDVIGPIGGWVRRTVKSSNEPISQVVADSELEAIRDILGFTTLDGETCAILGSNLALYLMNPNNEVVSITPTGFIGGNRDVTVETGYGAGVYGREYYSTPRSAKGLPVQDVFRWMLDTWGEDVIALGNGSPLYAYTYPSTEAVIIPNAPTDAADFIVTNERFIMTIGSATDKRLVRWSDRENREEWTPAVTNEAGSMSLQGIGSLRNISKVGTQILILSETDAYVARYVGPPFVYGFDNIGTNCAPISRKALVTVSERAFWLGKGKFWMFDGTLINLPCDLMNYLNKDLDTDNQSKLFSMSVDEHNEVWWFYQSTSGSEVDSYISYNYARNIWMMGKLDRTAGSDAGVFRLPIMVSCDGFIYNHEVSGVYLSDAYIESGPIELGQGDRNMAVRYIFPDTKATGSVSVTLIGRQMPNAPEVTYGPYAITNPTATRAMAREIRMRVNGISPSWRSGVMRFDIAEQGTGMR